MNENEKNLQEMIDEIEELVEESKVARFNPGKVMVDEQVLLTMLEELRSRVPTELERSHQIVNTKQNIIEDAKSQADAIMKNALKEANATVDDHEIVELAKIRANEIEAKAKQFADELTAKAKAEAKEIRLDAMEYTKDVMGGMESYMESLKKAQSAVYAQLLDGIDEEIAEIQANTAQLNKQLYAISSMNAPKARTLEDF